MYFFHQTKTYVESDSYDFLAKKSYHFLAEIFFGLNQIILLKNSRIAAALIIVSGGRILI